jgi:hypothetical protein
MVFDFGCEAFGEQDRFTPLAVQFRKGWLDDVNEYWGVSIWLLGFGVTIIFDGLDSWSFAEEE